MKTIKFKTEEERERNQLIKKKILKQPNKEFITINFGIIPIKL